MSDRYKFEESPQGQDFQGGAPLSPEGVRAADHYLLTQLGTFVAERLNRSGSHPSGWGEYAHYDDVRAKAVELGLAPASKVHDEQQIAHDKQVALQSLLGARVLEILREHAAGSLYPAGIKVFDAARSLGLLDEKGKVQP